VLTCDTADFVARMSSNRSRFVEVWSEQRRAGHGDQVSERVSARHEAFGKQTDGASLLLGKTGVEKPVDDIPKLRPAAKLHRARPWKWHVQAARLTASSIPIDACDP